MASRSKANKQMAYAQQDPRRVLGGVSLRDVANALQEGKRVSIMIGWSDLNRTDEDVAWIGDALAKACGRFRVDVVVGDEPCYDRIGLEICRRLRRIEKEGVPYGITVGIKELGSESPYRGIDLKGDSLDRRTLAVATARMESVIWNQNVWPCLVQITDSQTMMGFLAGCDVFSLDENENPVSVDAAVVFLDQGRITSCGYIRCFKDEAISIGLTPRPRPSWLD